MQKDREIGTAVHLATQDATMRIFVQNLQKQSGLATELIDCWKPDIVLAQEINWRSESNEIKQQSAKFVSRITGYGTAIYGTNNDDDDAFTNIRYVQSPHPELGGVIRKKTIIATYRGIVDFVSFHGYNGQPQKDVSKLVDHVKAVLAELDVRRTNNRPVVWAGDWNTWSVEHLKAVEEVLFSGDNPFRRACSWPYPGRDEPLDHVFVRGDSIQLESYSVHQCASDHLGALLVLKIAR